MGRMKPTKQKCQECEKLRERIQLDQGTIRGLAKSEKQYLDQRDKAREEAQEYQQSAESYQMLYSAEIEKRERLEQALLDRGVPYAEIKRIKEVTHG